MADNLRSIYCVKLLDWGRRGHWLVWMFLGYPVYNVFEVFQGMKNSARESIWWPVASLAAGKLSQSSQPSA